MGADPLAVPEMTDAQFLDFATEMYVAVAEEAYLWELPDGSLEMEAGVQVRYGPWRPADCMAALVVWFDAGFLGLSRRWPEDEPVPPDQAAELLRSADSWVQRADGSTNVAVVATDAGEALPADAWVHALEVLRTH